MRIVADDFIGAARIEQWQRGAVSANGQNVVDKVFGGLVAERLPRQPFAQRPNNCLRNSLSRLLGQRSLVGFEVAPAAGVVGFVLTKMMGSANARCFGLVLPKCTRASLAEFFEHRLPAEKFATFGLEIGANCLCLRPVCGPCPALPAVPE